MALHNEMSYNPSPPSKIAFFCEVTPEKGTGRTPLASSEEILTRVPAEVRKIYKEKGLMYIVNAPSEGKGPGVSWQRMYETEDRNEVDRVCASMGIETKWRDDGSLCTYRTATSTRTHPVTGREVWFNHSHLFHTSDLPPKTQAALDRIYPSKEHFPKNCMFADGSEIPKEYLDSVRKAQADSTMSWDWQKGDLMLLDNFVLCHGRNKYSPTRKQKRRILASMLF